MKYIMFILFALCVTYFIYNNSIEQFDCNDPISGPNVHGETKEEILVPVKPTINNPFMNPNIFDDITKHKASDYSDNTKESNEIKKEIYKKFSYNLYKDVDDIFDVNNNFRGFHTVPNNITNYDKFLKFVHGDFNYGTKQSTYDGFKNQYDPVQNRRKT